MEKMLFEQLYSGMDLGQFSFSFTRELWEAHLKALGISPDARALNMSPHPTIWARNYIRLVRQKYDAQGWIHRDADLMWYHPTMLPADVTISGRIHEVFTRHGNQGMTLITETWLQSTMLCRQYDSVIIHRVASPRSNSEPVAAALRGVRLGSLRVTRAMSTAFSGALAEPGFERNIHTDIAFASQRGWPDLVIEGRLFMMYGSMLLGSVLGSKWSQRGRLQMRFVSPVFAGNEVAFYWSASAPDEGIIDVVNVTRGESLAAQGIAQWGEKIEDHV